MIGYITSYLDPVDEVRRKIRFDTLILQLTEWVTNTNIDIYIVAMNYTTHELGIVHSISNRIYCDMQPSMYNVFTKNICLNHFYASQYHWGIFMDDDAVLYPHNSSYNIVSEMESHIDDYKNIDVFYPHNPMMCGFNHKYKIYDYSANHIFDNVIFPKGTMMFLRNFALYNQPPVYFDTEFNMMEDVAFYCNILLHGYRGHNCSNIILKEYSHNASYFNDNRVSEIRLNGHRIVDKYGGDLIKKQGGIGINFKYILNKNSKPCRVNIPKNGIQNNQHLFDW